MPTPAADHPAPPGSGSKEPTDAHRLTETVIRLRRALRASIRTDYSWEQLPMAQVELLQVLAEHSPMRVSDLAAQRRLAPSTVSRLVGQLLSQEMITRGTDPSDRRAAVVSLTGAGRKQLQGWTGANQDRIDHALDSLTAAQRRRLRSALPALDRLTDLLEQEL